MWIKVLLCISDQEYAGKMSNYFDKEYADKMEVNMFSDVDNMLNYLHNYGADIVLFDEAMEAWKKLYDEVGLDVQYYENLNDLECLYNVRKGLLK